MDSWAALAHRIAGDGEVLMWNHVVHSWVDPVTTVGLIVATVVAAWWALRRLTAPASDKEGD